RRRCPVHRNVDSPDRVRARNRPVTAECKTDAGVSHRRECEVVGLLVIVKKREFGLDEDRISTGPQRLDVGDQSAGRHSGEVLGVRDVKMRDLMAAASGRPVVLSQRVDRELESLVAHSMDMDVETMPLDSTGDLFEFFGREHEQPVFMIMATIGPFESSGEILTDSVEHDLHNGDLYTSGGAVAFDPSDHVSTLL